MSIRQTLHIAALGLLSVSLSQGQTVKTWTAANGDFYTPGNWDAGSVPGVTDIAVIDNNGTATIAANAGDRELGTFRLGSSGSASGHVIMNGGFLKIGGTQGDPKAVIGNSSTLSTFIMNGGTIWLDGPDANPGSRTSKGVNELDWEVGEAGMGRFEMHNDAVFRASDDLKIAEGAAGAGYFLIDGNARLSLGSGIGISSGGTNEQVMIMAGNALADAGNSMGAGHPDGSTDEGYLTLAMGGGKARLEIEDNAVLNIRILSSRGGVTRMTVKDKGQFHIFDVLTGRGIINAQTPPERPAVEDGANSTLSSEAPSDSILTLQDEAQMTVNAVAGLGISAPRNGGSATGGKARLTVRDRASLKIEQYLALGAGTQAATSDGTLEVAGPNAVVNIGSNFNMAVDNDGLIPTIDLTDDLGNQIPGKSTLRAVITGSTHSIVNVGGMARIAQGVLVVKLEGYNPVGGETYTLIKGGTVEGQFRRVDMAAAPLDPGLYWEVEYAADAVRLKVLAGRTLTVTTANNANPPAGSVSLLQAMTGLQKGDHIKFNIPGAGPHVIATPAGGYPLITVDHVTINGYSQPGATPNTNPIRAANNAAIKIVLDSRNGNSRLMDFAPTGPTDQTGYGDTESAVIGVLGAKGARIQGVSILAVPLTGPGTDIALYGVSFAKNASGHVNGCWIGVAPDGTTVAGPADGVTGFRYRVRDENSSPVEDILINDVIVGARPYAPNARAEFNVLVGIPAIPIILEGQGARISGNFINVMPDGMNDFNPPLANPDLFSGTSGGNIEIGRQGNNTVIGTDGDGVNDADEGNILAGLVPPSQGGYDHSIEFYGQTPGTNIVVAGNYFGLAVDGIKRFTNGVPALNAAGGSAQFRFGSDFDGVSDAWEANHAYNHWPAELFTVVDGSFFDELSAGAILSARGNVMVGNYPFPTHPLKGGTPLQFWADYYAKALVDSAAGTVPTLAAGTSRTRLVGTVPVSNPDFPVTIIDLYVADPEGMAYGLLSPLPELPNGYVQGKIWLASFVEGSAADRNPNPGEFDFDLAGLSVHGDKWTITATYSKSPAGTPNAVGLTSPFSEPVAGPGGGAAGRLTIAKTGANISVTFTGTLQSASAITGPWTDVAGTPASPLVIAPADQAAARFFRSRH